MTSTNRRTAALGEKIAEKFLKDRGFSILGKNYFTPFGEIDIIAKKNGILAFIEVKTRTSDRFGSPLHSITKKKKEHITKNCLYYLKRNGISAMPCRLDAIGIELGSDGNMNVLKYIKNITEITY